VVDDGDVVVLVWAVERTIPVIGEERDAEVVARVGGEDEEFAVLDYDLFV
jgi:hypothetical protein